MDTRLYSLKKTLNEISVCGEDNLDRLLGCIQVLSAMIQEQEEPKKEIILDTPLEEAISK